MFRGDRASERKRARRISRRNLTSSPRETSDCNVGAERTISEISSERTANIETLSTETLQGTILWNLKNTQLSFQLLRRRPGSFKMIQSKAGIVLLAASLLLTMMSTDSVPLNRSLRGSLRLCSRNLSDALYLVCRDRGYNGYSYGDDDEPQVDNGHGLVDECCYQTCSYEYLEQYCKPVQEEKREESRDVMEETYSIVHMAFPHAATDLSEENPRSEMDYVGGAIKRKVDGMKREQHRGKDGRKGVGECKGKADAKKQHRGRHCRCRRRRLECRRTGKVLRGDVKHLDNKFVMSPAMDKPTSSPIVS